MSENVMTLDSPFTREAFRKLDAENLNMWELADRVREGDRSSMMRMFTLLHDEMYAIARKTIESAHQAEFLVRRTFAEVFYDHENIDPDIFELNLMQVLSENIRKMDIRNTYTAVLKKPLVLPKEGSEKKPEPVSTVTVESSAMALPLEDAGSTAAARENEKTLSHTRALPVILSSVAAISAVGTGVNIAHAQKLKRMKALSYANMMDALQISFDQAEDGSELTVLEYSADGSVSTEGLVSSYTGNLNTDTDAINLSKVGDQIVTYSLSKTDTYGQRAKSSVTKTYTVKDTKAPVIEASETEVTITEGDSFSADALVTSVSDPADGALVKVDSEPEKLTDDESGRLYETGWYTVQSSVDVNTPGEYNVLVHACDIHGNVTETNIPVTVKAKPVQIVSASSAAVTGAVSVNTGANAESIYSLLRNTYGLTKSAACGILANISIESSFNPNVGTDYYGLCQWGGNRISNLVAFCAANGYSSSSVDGQIAFMISEMGSGMTGVLNSTEDSAEGAAQAGVYFRQNFERSAGLNNVANIAASYYNTMA